MSDQKNRKAVYTIVEGSGDKKRWIRIGIAFVNRDASMNVLLDALPVNGQLHIRDFPPSEEQDAGSTEQAAETTARKPRAAAAA